MNQFTAVNNISPKYFIVLVLLLIINTPLYAAEDWVAEEIFKQISELRRDNNQLRKEVEQLKGQVAQLKSGGKRNVVSSVSLGDDHILSNQTDTAKVAIIEFSDYECPFCKRHHVQTLPKLKQNYIDTGKVQYVMRDFPLGFHKNAKSAAIAANCAGEQQAYWSMHDALFESKVAKGRTLYTQLAAQLKLDGEKFNQCLDDPVQAKEVDADMAYGASVGVSGTPAFFVGKIKEGNIVDAQFISGAQSYTKFEKIINSMLD